MELPLRPNVCMLLFNQEGMVFLGERFNEPGVWQFPQGGVEPDQSLENNALRELSEELGIDLAYLKPVKQLEHTHSYEWTNPPAYAVGKWRGQAQKFWAVNFIGNDSEINLAKHSPQEFSRWRWCPLDQVLRSVPPHRAAGYRGAINECSNWRKQL